MRCEMSKTVNANIQKFTTSRGLDSFVFVVFQTWQDLVVSYARVTLRDKNVSRKILKITVIINKLLNEKIRYNYRRKKTQAVVVTNQLRWLENFSQLVLEQRGLVGE